MGESPEIATRYKGRFAPSPTGPLHMGSLLAAVASYLDAKAAHGEWLVRMEDLDPPREVAGAGDDILRALDAHGLHWDGAVRYQSERLPAYEAALQTLDDAGLIFRCCCTRSTLRGGSCGQRCKPEQDSVCSYRVTLLGSPDFEDVFLGPQTLSVPQKDQILKRKDGFHAYALAVVVDDADQAITRVVRGVDLMDQTPAQCYLHHCFRHPAPEFGHVPVILDRHGVKLSKQTGAAAIDNARAADNLRHVLRHLGQEEVDADAVEPSALLAEAVAQWQIPPIAKQTPL